MADLAPYSTIRELARGERPWHKDLIPLVAAAQADALINSSSLKGRPPQYGGRMPDPQPLRTLAEQACVRILAQTATGADYRAVAEYAADLIRSQILES